MGDGSALDRLVAEKQLQRGAAVHMYASKLVKSPMVGMVEFVKPGFLIVSYVHAGELVVSLLGSIVRIQLETAASVTTLELEVVQEEMVWPVRLLGLLPQSVKTTSKDEMPQVQPDTTITVPYKVMGAKPNEEQGEGVLLQFTPYRLMLHTGGYLSKGDFLHLSFTVPRTKQEIHAMAQVVEKSFQDSSAVVMLAITDIQDRCQQWLQEYYHKISKTAPR